MEIVVVDNTDIEKTIEEDTSVERRRSEEQPLVRVVTVATKDDGYLPTLRHSLPCLEVLGFNRPWNGYISKFEYLDERLRDFNDDQIVVFIDAYDVIYNPAKGDVQSIGEEFKKFNVDILFSATNFSTYSPMAQFYVKKVFFGLFDTTYTVNCGLFMGYAWALRRLIQDAYTLSSICDGELDDERLVNMSLNKFGSRVYTLPRTPCDPCKFMINYRNNLFTVGVDLDKHIFHNYIVDAIFKKIFHPYSPPVEVMHNANAYFYHFVGNQNIDNICDYLNLPYVKRNREYTTLMKIKHYSQYFQTEIIIIIVILIIVGLLIAYRKSISEYFSMEHV